MHELNVEHLSRLFARSKKGTLPSDDGITVQELSELTGVPANRVRTLIKYGVQIGAIAVGKRFVDNDWDGRSRVYTVFRWLEGKAPEEEKA